MCKNDAENIDFLATLSCDARGCILHPCTIRAHGRFPRGREVKAGEGDACLSRVYMCEANVLPTPQRPFDVFIIDGKCDFTHFHFNIRNGLCCVSFTFKLMF